MSYATRPVEQSVMICDLCKKIIPEKTHPMDTASLSHGYIANRVTERTKRVWFRWPDLNRPGGRYDWQREVEAREKRVEYDFHAECIYALVKEAVEGGRTAEVAAKALEEAADLAEGVECIVIDPVMEKIGKNVGLSLAQEFRALAAEYRKAVPDD